LGCPNIPHFPCVECADIGAVGAAAKKLQRAKAQLRRLEAEHLNGAEALASWPLCYPECYLYLFHFPASLYSICMNQSLCSAARQATMTLAGLGPQSRRKM
jgi:hypothetical protein